MLQHDYVERPIDGELLHIARAWLADACAPRWISLHASPGYGATSLLQHLARHVSKDVAFNGILVLSAPAVPLGRRGRPERSGPLAAAAARASLEHGSLLKRLARRARQMGAWDLARVGGVVGACVAASCLWTGLHEYITSTLAPVREWPRDFVLNYLPSQWHKFPVWFADGLLLGLPMAAAGTYVTRGRLFADAKLVPGPEDLKPLESPPQLARRLLDLAQGHRAVVLLLDHADELPPHEEDVAIDFFADPDPGAAPLQARPGVLVVSVDGEDVDRAARLPRTSAERFARLPVPPFTPAELRRIAEHLGPGERPEGEAALEELVRNANGSARALFALRDAKLKANIGRAYQDAERDDAKARVFGRARLLAYCAARRESSCTREELRQWLASPGLRDHLQVFGLRPLPPKLLLRFLRDRSTLVRSRGDLRRFDPARCDALRGWLEEHRRDVLAEAEYYWGTHPSGLTIEPPRHASLAMGLPADERHHLARGAWHLAQIGRLPEPPADIVTKAPGWSPQERAAGRIDAFRRLLAAAAVQRCEGRLDEAHDLAMDALEWLDDGEDVPLDLVSAVAEQLWWNHWLSGNPRARAKLEELAARWSGLEARPSWRVHARFAALLQADASVPAPPAETELVLDAERNLLRLADFFSLVRERHGLLAPALADRALALPDVLACAGDRQAELHLCELRARAAWQRAAAGAAARDAAEWWARVQSSAADAGLVQRCLQSLSEGSFWLHVCDVAAGARGPHASEHGDDAGPASAVLAVLPGGLRGTAAVAHARQAAAAGYLAALRIADRLGLEPLGLEARFGFATLLLRHTPQDQRRPDPPWWDVWDALHAACLDAERRLGQCRIAPEIHHARFEFFRSLAHEYCLEDAYNLLVAIKRARYPTATILEWHVNVQRYFNNYGDSEVDRRRSAELFEEWARTLSPLEQARPLHSFAVLAHEQAEALHYAAQARRLAGELSDALALLDEAERLMREAPEAAAAAADEAEKARNLGLSLRLQRAWVLAQLPERETEYRRQVRALWKEVQRGDEDRVVLLRTLTQIEERESLLREPWPPSPDLAPHQDPDNAELSLPASWLDEGNGLELRTRIEFRLWQLLSFVDREPPDPQRLRMAALLSWLGLGKSFGDTALQLAALGSRHKVGPVTRRMLRALLEAVRFYFKHVEEVDQAELEALRLLMVHAHDARYRDEYVAVLYESKKLLERELRVRAEAGAQPDWLWIVRRLAEYFVVLVDERLQQHVLAAHLASRGGALQDFLAAHRERAAQTASARAAYEHGEWNACRDLLRPLLPTTEPPWVFMEDLEALDLWIRCERRLPSRPAAELHMRAEQLASGCRQYVRQLSAGIREEKIQQLALDLVPAGTRAGA